MLITLGFIQSVSAADKMRCKSKKEYIEFSKTSPFAVNFSEDNFTKKSLSIYHDMGRIEKEQASRPLIPNTGRINFYNHFMQEQCLADAFYKNLDEAKYLKCFDSICTLSTLLSAMIGIAVATIDKLYIYKDEKKINPTQQDILVGLGWAISIFESIELALDIITRKRKDYIIGKFINTATSKIDKNAAQSIDFKRKSTVIEPEQFKNICCTCCICTIKCCRDKNLKFRLKITYETLGSCLCFCSMLCGVAIAVLNSPEVFGDYLNREKVEESNIIFSLGLTLFAFEMLELIIDNCCEKKRAFFRVKYSYKEKNLNSLD